MNETMMIALIDLILKYGPKSAITLIQSLDSSEPTLQEIENLKVNPPEDYFKED